MRTNVTRQFRSRERNVHYVVVSFPGTKVHGNETSRYRNALVVCGIDYWGRPKHFIFYVCWHYLGKYICLLRKLHKVLFKVLTVMSNARLVAVRRLFNSASWNCSISKMTYHTDTAEILRSNVDTNCPDYKVTEILIEVGLMKIEYTLQSTSRLSTN